MKYSDYTRAVQKGSWKYGPAEREAQMLLTQEPDMDNAIVGSIGKKYVPRAFWLLGILFSPFA